MFGYTLIKKERLKELENYELLHMRMCHYSYWFSGWPHVYRLLRGFAEGKVWCGSVWGEREEFAKAMGTDDYGNERKP